MSKVFNKFLRGINFGRVNPSFMVIGVQKGGTSSLYYYLAQHPSLIAPTEKELHYFDTFKETPSTAYSLHFPKSYFTTKKSFEATPRYIYYPGTAKKIFEYNPKMKFIVMLRDPVKRAFSAWNMYGQLVMSEKMKKYFKDIESQNSKEKLYTYFVKNKFPSFGDWVNYELNLTETEKLGLIEPSIVRRGYYEEQILEYLKFFKKSQFKFIDSDDLLKSPKESMRSVFKFLNLSDVYLDEFDFSLKHKRKYDDRIDSKTKAALSEHYSQKNKNLENIIGMKLNWISL